MGIMVNRDVSSFLNCILAVLVLVVTFIPLTLAGAEPPSQSPQEGKAIFENQCASCHTIGGGPTVGPDLEGVAERREKQWLIDFIMNPGELIDSGDPTANQLLAEFNNVRMPDVGLNQTETETVLAYLENPQAADGGNQQEAQIDLAAGVPGTGRSLYIGEQRLANGGTPCIACHSVAGVGQFGGGSLGPDLTQVYTRYGGDQGLVNALSGMPFPTMQGIFVNQPLTPQEQADLVAFFRKADSLYNRPAPNYFWLFLGGGVLGGLMLFGAMAFFWPRQRKSIVDQIRENSRN